MECYICLNCLHLYLQGVSNYFWGTIKQNGLPRWCLVVKSPPASAGRCKSLGFDPWVGKISWRRAWQLPPVLLSREFHGQRSLAGLHRAAQSWTQLKWLSSSSVKQTALSETLLSFEIKECEPTCKYRYFDDSTCI